MSPESSPENRGHVPDILTPSAFDKRVQEDPLFAARIAGVTTLPISFLDSDFSIQPYGHEPHISVHVRPEVYGLLGIPFEYSDVSELQFPEFIKYNRSVFSSFMVASEVVQLAKNPIIEHHRDEFFNEILHPLIISYRERIQNNPHAPITLESLKKQHRRYSYPVNIRQMARILGQYFGSVEEFLKILDSHKTVGGIQVVYGPLDDFTNWVNQQTYRAVDESGIEIQNVAVPSRYVICIIPLGEAEQKQLGVV